MVITSSVGIWASITMLMYPVLLSYTTKFRDTELRTIIRAVPRQGTAMGPITLNLRSRKAGAKFAKSLPSKCDMKGSPEATNSLARFLLPLKSRWVYPKHHACMNSESPDVYVLDCQKLPKSFLHRFPALAVSMDLCKHHLAVAQKTGTD